MTFDQLQRVSGDEFKRFDAVAEPGSHSCQQSYRATRIRQGHQQRGGFARIGVQPEGGSGNYSECSLAAYEQLLEIVSRRVLVERTQAVDDATVRQHHFEAEDLLPRRAVSNDIYTPRIRREVATNLTAPFRTETQREIAIDGARFILQGGQDTARLRNHRKVLRVD